LKDRETKQKDIERNIMTEQERERKRKTEKEGDS
jgi:hypothetical protein